MDPWGAAFVYRLQSDAKTYEVISLGPDGIEGTDDDLNTKSLP